MKKAGLSAIAIFSIFFLASSFFQEFDLPKSIERGKEVYATYCMSCHMEDGSATEGIYPPLAHADYLQNSPDSLLISIVLEGQSGEVEVNGEKYEDQMLGFSYLSDEQVSDVLNYVRNSWGNKLPAILPQQVKEVRQ